jgi:hypothetical protein
MTALEAVSDISGGFFFYFEKLISFHSFVNLPANSTLHSNEQGSIALHDLSSL